MTDWTRVLASGFVEAYDEAMARAALDQDVRAKIHQIATKLLPEKLKAARAS